ncbi:hypothetical protein Emed_001288 [Eimeria media]
MLVLPLVGGLYVVPSGPLRGPPAAHVSLTPQIAEKAVEGLLALGRSPCQEADPPVSLKATGQKQQLSFPPSSSVQPQSSQAHRNSSSSLAALSEKEMRDATAAATAAGSLCCSATCVDDKSGGGRALSEGGAQACWWRPPPPLFVRSLHTSATAAELRAAFASFGSLRCVLASGSRPEQRTPGDSSGCMQSQTLRKRRAPGGSRAEVGVGLLWFTDHEATLRALHAAPRLFRGLPCSLQPSSLSPNWKPFILLHGGPLMVGHAWRRCRECGSIAFESAAAAPAAADVPAAATAAAAVNADGNIMVALRLGEEKQLRIAWAEGRHAVLLELPVRALVNRVYLLVAAPAAGTCSSNGSSSSSSGRVTDQQQHLLLCPEHAPRVTVAEVVEGRPSSQLVADEAASAAAALLLGEEAAVVSPGWRCVRWACGAEEQAGLVSPLLQRLSDCRDLLLPLSLPTCVQRPRKETHAGETMKSGKGGSSLSLLRPHEGWVAELKACGLLVSKKASTAILTEEPRERRRHMLLVSRAVLQRDPSLLKAVSFSLTPFPKIENCFSCAAVAAAASSLAAASVDKESEAQKAAGTGRAAGVPQQSVNCSAESRQGEQQREKTVGAFLPLNADDPEDKDPFPPPPSGWLLWVELQEMLSSGLLPAPCLFELCPSPSVRAGYQEGLLQGAPPPLALLLADPRREAHVLRKALRRLALEKLMEGEAISSVSPAARLYALLQELEAAYTPEDCSSSCMDGVCELMHIQMTPLRTLCVGVFQENTNRLLRLFPSLADGGGFVRAGVAEETGARLYHNSMLLVLKLLLVLLLLLLFLLLWLLLLRLINDAASCVYCRSSNATGRNTQKGCGFMSGELWRRLGALHPQLSRSSALQLRLGGFKGMLALHPAFPKEALSRGVHVFLHHSMKKLDSQLTILEVNDHSRRLAAFLNHQVILILDTLQVPLQTFERLQQRMLDLLKGPARQRGELLALMHWAETDQDARGPAERIVFELLRSSAFSLRELFLHDVAAAAETQCLHLLKNKARIFVEKGAYLFGVVDPTHTLLYDHGWRQNSPSSRRCAGLPEVFVHLTSLAASRRMPRESEEDEPSGGHSSTSNSSSNNNSSSSSSKDRFADVARPLPCSPRGPHADYRVPHSEVLSGVVAVVKSPCMHPGDLQLCYAVGVEQLPLGSPLRSPLEKTPSQDDPDPAAFAFRDLLVFPPPPVGWFNNCQGTRWPSLNPRHPGVLRKEPQVEYHFRDVPNMLSGGDLDGDRYWVLWEPAIVGPLLERWQQGLAPSPVAAHEPDSAAHTAVNSDAAAAAAAWSSSDSSSAMDASDSERQSDTSEDDDSVAAVAAAADKVAAARAGGEEAAGVEVHALEQTESSEGDATTTAASLLPLSTTPTGSSRDSDGFVGLQQAAVAKGGEEVEATASEALAEDNSSSLDQLARFLLHVQNTWKLGTIANTHLRSAHAPAAYYAANGMKAKALDRAAVALADLAAAAVDAPKTGSKVKLTRELRCPLVPHFLERLKRRQLAFAASVANPAARRGLRLFASRSILGCLYDRVCEAHLHLQSPTPLSLSPHCPQEQLAKTNTQPALSPQQVTAYWEGVQHKEEARLLFTGDTRVHCLRVDVTLPGALVVGGPSLPEGAPTLQANTKPTLRALLFSVHPASHACPQQSSRSLHAHSSSSKSEAADGSCCMRLPVSAPNSTHAARPDCPLLHLEEAQGELPHPLLFCSLNVTLAIAVADPAAAQGQLSVGGASAVAAATANYLVADVAAAVAASLSLEYQTPQSGAACRSPFVFSPPTRLPPESAWGGGEDFTVYVHCAAAPADLEALRDSLNVQLVALLPPAVSASVLLQRLSPLPSISLTSTATQGVVYCGRLGGDSSSRSQLHALLFRRGTHIECCAAVDASAGSEQQQQPLAVLSATPQDVSWEDWRFMPWLTELKGDLFLLRCLSISSKNSLHADTCSTSSGSSSSSSSSSTSSSGWEEADAELVGRLSKLLVGAVELQQHNALRLFPQLGPPISTSSLRPVAAAYKGKAHAGKRSKLFVVLERSLTGLCLRLLLAELLAALPSSWPPAARMQRLSHALGLRIYLPQLPSLLGSPDNSTPDLSRGAMDVVGAKALLQHYWQHRKHLLLQRQPQLQQQQQQRREPRASIKAWLVAATQGGRAMPKDVIYTGETRATLVFSTGWEASCFLNQQVEGLNYLSGIVVSRPCIPLEAALTPLWPPVHPCIKAAAAKQQDALDKASQDTALTAPVPAELPLKKPDCVESVCGVRTPAITFDSSSLPLSHLPSWHLRLRGIATQGALISFLRDFYKGALPLPMTTLEGPPLGASLAGVGGGAPRELSLDLDLMSWCPDKLLMFGRQVAKLKAAWDEEVSLLMLRFASPDEASLLSGLVDKDAEGPLSNMDSWTGKLQLAVLGLHALFKRRRFFRLSLNSEEKQIVAVSAYYFSYVSTEALKAFIAKGDPVSSANLRPQTTKLTSEQQPQQQQQQQQQQQTQQQQQQQQHLFSFPWMLYHRELKDIKALAAARAALQPP